MYGVPTFIASQRVAHSGQPIRKYVYTVTDGRLTREQKTMAVLQFMRLLSIYIFFSCYNSVREAPAGLLIGTLWCLLEMLN